MRFIDNIIVEGVNHISKLILINSVTEYKLHRYTKIWSPYMSFCSVITSSVTINNTILAGLVTAAFIKSYFAVNITNQSTRAWNNMVINTSK